MMPTARLFSIALATLLSLVIADANAEDGCVPVPEQAATNADQSTISLATTCDPSGARRYILRARAQGGEMQELVVEPDTDDPSRGSAELVDVDSDGHHEIEVRGMCGAGPNCLGDLYRLNRRTGKLQQFLSGGYASLLVIDGHLVESGRASCCSWEYHAYKLDNRDEVRGYENMELMVQVGADLSSDDEDAPARCTFSRRMGGDWVVVPPPGRQWLSLCDVYGDDYHLVTPQEAREAEQSAAAQE